MSKSFDQPEKRLPRLSGDVIPGSGESSFWAGGGTLFWLAMPVLGEQFCNIFVGIFDTLLAGQINKEAIAAVGLAAYVGWLATMLSGFIGIGATALVARFSGAGDAPQAGEITNQAMGLAGIWGAILAVGLFFMSSVIPRWMDLGDSAYPVAVQYLRIDAVGQFFYAYMLIGSACLRGRGDTRTPMYVIVCVNIINAVLSTLLVFGPGPFPELHAVGIAIGTVTSRVLGGLIMILLLVRGKSGLKIGRSEMKPRLETARRILRIGVPAGVDAAIMWSGHFIFLTFIARVDPNPEVGLAAYAAHMIGIRIESFSFLPAMAWGIAAATLVGQSLGAGQHARAKRIGHIATMQLLPWCMAVVVLYFLLADPVYRVWSNDPLVHDQGVPALQMAAWFQPFLIVLIVYIHALRGAGDTKFPMLFTIVGIFGIRIPLAYYFGVVCSGGLVGAWIGMVVDIFIRALLTTWRYCSDAWTRKMI